MVSTYYPIQIFQDDFIERETKKYEELRRKDEEALNFKINQQL